MGQASDLVGDRELCPSGRSGSVQPIADCGGPSPVSPGRPIVGDHDSQVAVSLEEDDQPAHRAAAAEWTVGALVRSTPQRGGSTELSSQNPEVSRSNPEDLRVTK